jgi:hydrogenase maturation protease
VISASPKILAVGNPDRGDDGVGPYVLAGLAGRIPGVELLQADGEVSSLLAIFEQSSTLILIDAADARTAGMAPGDILRLTADDPRLARSGLRASSHALGVAEAIALARTLGLLPARLSIIAIAGACFAPGAALSPAVASAADALREELIEAYYLSRCDRIDFACQD